MAIVARRRGVDGRVGCHSVRDSTAGLKNGPVVAVVPPSDSPVVRCEAVNYDLSRARWLSDRSWCCSRGCSCEGGAAACYDCCALQVGTANSSAIVQNAHVASLAVVAAAAAGCALRHALVFTAGKPRWARTAWAASLAWLEAVPVSATLVAAGTATAQIWVDGQWALEPLARKKDSLEQ